MKLIINISETDYNTYKHFGDKGSYTERIIANGVPYKQDERPKGKWIAQDEFGACFKCSNCGIGIDNDFPVYRSYCPNCGANMRGDA